MQPLKSSIAEETFQTVLVMQALKDLGYEVEPIKEIEYAAGHIAIGNGDAPFMADHWDPLHVDFYEKAGGDANNFEHDREEAERALEAVERLLQLDQPLAYARVDLIRDDDGSPRLLELELTEPSLFFEQAAGSAQRFAAALEQRLVALSIDPACKQ